MSAFCPFPVLKNIQIKTFTSENTDVYINICCSNCRIKFGKESMELLSWVLYHLPIKHKIVLPGSPKGLGKKLLIMTKRGEIIVELNVRALP